MHLHCGGWPSWKLLANVTTSKPQIRPLCLIFKSLHVCSCSLLSTVVLLLPHCHPPLVDVPSELPRSTLWALVHVRCQFAAWPFIQFIAVCHFLISCTDYCLMCPNDVITHLQSRLIKISCWLSSVMPSMMAMPVLPLQVCLGNAFGAGVNSLAWAELWACTAQHVWWVQLSCWL